MPRFYKGSGPGTHYWLPANDPRIRGFQAPPSAPPGADAAVRHITNYSVPSSYVSITTSFAIARGYALAGPGGAASSVQPGRVWEIQLDPSHRVHVDVPVKLISSAYGDRLHHDGDARLISNLSIGNLPSPYQINGFNVNWNVAQELQAVVYALRDAELLADRILPVCVVGVKDVW